MKAHTDADISTKPHTELRQNKPFQLSTVHSWLTSTFVPSNFNFQSSLNNIARVKLLPYPSITSGMDAAEHSFGCHLPSPSISKISCVSQSHS